MTSPLTSFAYLTLVADADTPPEHAAKAGTVVGLPPEYLTAIGSGPSNPGVILGIRGHHRTGGATGHEWLMTPPFSPALRDQLLAIPGGSGWVLVPARNVYRDAAIALLGTYGMTAPDVVTLLNNLYDAAVANDHAVP